jgi:hypothetical protein
MHHILRIVWVFVLSCAVCGCGSSAPTVFPVYGKIVFEKGGDLKKLAGATVEFESVADSKIHAYGTIKEDGSFAMTTRVGDVAQLGAVAGEHKIRILFEVQHDTDDYKPPPPPIHPRFTSFKDSKLTCTVPLSGELVLKVSR